ncbi:hypothetical protein EKO04_005756 [Ascochyta lentis]|uniref:Uncharacterized protein n=1 Tax=Ascochyta lentis TaxID=205686 RepID=A0A8H7MJH2_9PLEO|nr:hypothetical protein EKO04_005756 [Ascochyta lentis]
MNEISRLTGAEYEAGVWKHNLTVELAWMVGPFVVDGDVFSNSQATRLPGIPSWSWGSVNKELIFKFGDHIKYRALAPNASIHAQEVRVRVRMGNLQLQKMEIVAGVCSLNWERYYPHHCVFQPAGDIPLENCYDNVKELAVFDTLADTLPAEGGTVKCIPWLEFPIVLGEIWRDFSAISAMMTTPVDEEKNIYRRIGWVDLWEDTDIFSEEYQDITIV